MIKRIGLFLIGIIPLGIGITMNSWMMENQYTLPPLKTIGILFLVFWIFIGAITVNIDKTPLKSAILVNLPALIMVLLIIFQGVILGRFWPNLFGIATQYFYLPLINISSLIVGFFYALTGWSISIVEIGIVSFLLMVGSYYLGSFLRTYRMYK